MMLFRIKMPKKNFQHGKIIYITNIRNRTDLYVYSYIYLVIFISYLSNKHHRFV